MINKDEIEQKSEQLGVHVSNVQRDYVFGWLLAGLFQQDNPLRDLLILKGGNAFRKAYFENARFSNDLDFSTEVELSEEILRDGVSQACVFAKASSGVEFLIDQSRIGTRSLAQEESTLYEARVYFKSFYGEEDITLKVKLDIKEFDRIFLPVQTRKLIHAYSDHSKCQGELRCLKLEELLASKLKALLQRRHSPDLYDFVYSIFFQKALDVTRREIITTFLKKTIYEPTPQVARNLLLELPFQALRGLWNEYLVCPKVSAVTFEDAEVIFRSSIAELFGLIAPKPQPAFATTGVGGDARVSFYGSSYRDTIMEAGRLKRLLKLVYDGYERLVEPYALAFKRRKDGIAQEYFYAWDLSGGQSGQIGIKSFISDNVQSVQLTEQTFQPRFPIELAGGSGYFSATSFSSRTDSSSAFGASRPRSQSRSSGFGRTSSSLFGGSRKKTGSPFGITYTVQCPYCNKRFKRDRLDTKLNEHKDRYGNRCYGRTGFIV
ncbi:MAG: nucleotidyl transferase AbiEii/AbiGii toxin family protein [Sulfuricaulis sp.]